MGGKVIRLPSAVIKALDPKDDDEVEIRIAGEREIEIARDRGGETAMKRIRQLRRPLPPGFKFDRSETNER